MKRMKRTMFGPGRLATLLLLSCVPLLTGCNTALAWGYALGWYALLVFAPLRSLYGSAALNLVNTL